LPVELRDEPIIKSGNGEKATRGQWMLGGLGWILPLLVPTQQNINRF
jgi:hypothetical protein